MMRFVGYDNFVNSELIAVVLRSDRFSVKRLKRGAEEKGMLVDTGKKIRKD